MFRPRNRGLTVSRQGLHIVTNTDPEIPRAFTQLLHQGGA
jgi:hypothetical protein